MVITLCELLGLTFNLPVTSNVSFTGFRQRAEANPDGWGLAFYPDKSAQVFKPVVVLPIHILEQAADINEQAADINEKRGITKIIRLQDQHAEDSRELNRLAKEKKGKVVE